MIMFPLMKFGSLHIEIILNATNPIILSIWPIKVIKDGIPFRVHLRKQTSIYFFFPKKHYSYNRSLITNKSSSLLESNNRYSTYLIPENS